MLIIVITYWGQLSVYDVSASLCSELDYMPCRYPAISWNLYIVIIIIITCWNRGSEAEQATYRACVSRGAAEGAAAK